MISALFLSTIILAQQPSYPPGCEEATFPNSDECYEKNWFLGYDAKDRCAPLGSIPVRGQQVYIQDPLNFCMLLPDDNSPYLKREYYSKNRFPTILAGEGYAQSRCMGSYRTPGAFAMKPGAIRSAHVSFGTISGKTYVQIYGTIDCTAAEIDCVGDGVGTYTDGGQYDSVRFINCGKLPYSGVDAGRHPGLVEYNMQAGNGIFCMRICQEGTQETDPCNVKWDTRGCQATMGITNMERPGFTLTERSGTVRNFDVNLPPANPRQTGSVTGPSATTTTSRPGSGTSGISATVGSNPAQKTVGSSGASDNTFKAAAALLALAAL